MSQQRTLVLWLLVMEGVSQWFALRAQSLFPGRCFRVHDLLPAHVHKIPTHLVAAQMMKRDVEVDLKLL